MCGIRAWESKVLGYHTDLSSFRFRALIADRYSAEFTLGEDWLSLFCSTQRYLGKDSRGEPPRRGATRPLLGTNEPVVNGATQSLYYQKFFLKLSEAAPKWRHRYHTQT